MATRKPTPAQKHKPAAKLSEAEKVAAFMDALEHPLKAEITALRQIIRNADSRISEHIKWNAPSYYYREDIATFHLRPADHVLLVFHHPSIAAIPSPLLQGAYKDRRLAYFRNMEDVRSNEAELIRIIRKVIEHIEAVK